MIQLLKKFDGTNQWYLNDVEVKLEKSPYDYE